MKLRRSLSVLLALAACGAESTTTIPGGDPVAALRSAVAAVAASPEHSASRVRVQHILIGFKGATRSNAMRSKDEAEKLAAEIYAKANAPGADFGALMRQYSEDPGGGDYVMVAGRASGPNEFARGDMAPAFGDVGWRLDVGAIGVAPFDLRKSPFGWHLIKRVE